NFKTHARADPRPHPYAADIIEILNVGNEVAENMKKEAPKDMFLMYLRYTLTHLEEISRRRSAYCGGQLENAIPKVLADKRIVGEQHCSVCKQPFLIGQLVGEPGQCGHKAHLNCVHLIHGHVDYQRREIRMVCPVCGQEFVKYGWSEEWEKKH